MAYKCKSGPAKMTDPSKNLNFKAYADRASGERLVSSSTVSTPNNKSPFSGYSRTTTRTYETPGTPGSYTKPKFTPAGDAAYKKMSLSERKIADDKYIAGNTKPGTEPTRRTVSQTLNYSGIKPMGGAKITGSMAGLQPLVKKPPTGTIPPSPRKTRKKFKNTDVGKFIKKTGRAIGNIQIRLPKFRLPKLGLGRKSSGGKGACNICSKKFNRTRGR
jgi:hypothetical protein